MRKMGLNSAALAVVVLGALQLNPRPASAAETSFCYICVQAIIMCEDVSEWDEPCRSWCGPGSEAFHCPVSDELCDPNQMFVECRDM